MRNFLKRHLFDIILIALCVLLLVVADGPTLTVEYETLDKLATFGWALTPWALVFMAFILSHIAARAGDAWVDLKRSEADRNDAETINTEFYTQCAREDRDQVVAK